MSYVRFQYNLICKHFFFIKKLTLIVLYKGNLFTFRYTLKYITKNEVCRTSICPYYA